MRFRQSLPVSGSWPWGNDPWSSSIPWTCGLGGNASVILSSFSLSGHNQFPRANGTDPVPTAEGVDHPSPPNERRISRHRHGACCINYIPITIFVQENNLTVEDTDNSPRVVYRRNSLIMDKAIRSKRGQSISTLLCKHRPKS